MPKYSPQKSKIQNNPSFDKKLRKIWHTFYPSTTSFIQHLHGCMDVMNVMDVVNIMNVMDGMDVMDVMNFMDVMDVIDVLTSSWRPGDCL